MRKILAFVMAGMLLSLSVGAVAESPIFGLVIDSKTETVAETVEVTLPEAAENPAAAQADASFVFTFRDGITWNTTLDELKGLFPGSEIYESDGLGEESVLGYKAFVSMTAQDVNMGVMQSNLVFGLVNGKLVMMGYDYVLMADDAPVYYDSDERYELLKQNLTVKYGAPAFDNWDSAIAVIPEGMSKQSMIQEAEYTADEAFNAWLLPDNTLIYLCGEELFYVNYLAMDAHVNALQAEMEAALAAEEEMLNQQINEDLQSVI